MGRSKTAAPQLGVVAGRLELDWRGHLDADDASGARRVSVARDETGWLLVVHGQAVNDDGTAYSWSRQEIGADGHPVRHGQLEDALALAGELVERFDAEHEESEAVRRVEEAEARRVVEQAAAAAADAASSVESEEE